MGTRRNPGKYDCYHAAHPNEPMFILLGRDRFGASLVRYWVAARNALSGGSRQETEKLLDASVCSSDMKKWCEEKKGRSLDVLEWLPFDILAQELTRRGIPLPVVMGVPVKRDEEGHWSHPHFPFGAAQDEMSLEPVGVGLGLEMAGICMSDTDLPQEIHEAAGEGNCSAWEPQPPEGEGWFLVTIHETEDGPAALWARQDTSRLWSVHIEGPDDIQAAPSYNAAVKAAENLNKWWSSTRMPTTPPIKAVVELWPFSLEEHADDLTNWAEFSGATPVQQVEQSNV
ncbi:MAG: hypothetical protein V4614_15130 [Pseudomonadota bacterium]